MLKQKFILSIIMQILTLIVGMASNIVMARIGGPNLLGTLAYGMAFVSVFHFLTDLGISTAHQKLVTSTDNIGDYVATFTILKIFTSLLFLIIVLIYYWIQVNIISNKDLANNEVRYVILIFIAVYFFNSLNYIFRTNFIAFAERAKVEIPSFLQSVMEKISRIVLVSNGYGAIFLALTTLILEVLALPFNYFLFKSYKYGIFKKSLVKNYFQISLLIIIINFSQQLAENIDRILLSTFHGNTELGFYIAAFSISALVKLFGSSLSSVLFPSFSSMLYKNEIYEISKIIEKYQKYLITLIFPLIVIVIIFSSDIILILYGKTYVPTTKFFPFIILALFVFIYSLPYLNLAFAKGLYKHVAAFSILILIIESVLIVFLSSGFFLNLKSLGVALAYFITNIINFLLYNKIVSSFIKIPQNPLLRYLFIFQIFLGLIAYILIKCDVIILYILIPLTYLFLVLFIEHRFLLITKGDISFLFKFFNIKFLLEYVKTEFSKKDE